MSDVFVFTASNPIAQRHWRESIANPVDPELVYSTFPSSTHVELDNIRDRCQGFYCWGATPGDSNIPTWEMMKTGDLVPGYQEIESPAMRRVFLCPPSAHTMSAMRPKADIKLE